jgi:hypothetical protein
MMPRAAGRRSIGHARRTRPIKRASAGLSPVRAGAGLAMVASAAVIYGVAASSAFGFSQLRIDGQRYTAEDAIRRELDLEDGANLFSLSTEPLAARLRALPTIADASVNVALPDTIAVDLVERVPLLVWQVGERRYLVDREGRLFAPVGDPASTDAGHLPRLVDERAAAVGLVVGSVLDPVDLDAATRLGSLKPGDVGSAAEKLTISITDQNGFVLRTEPEGWTAIFGFYTPTLRTPDLIPGQVRLLRSKLGEAGEATIERIILASDPDGTYVPKPSPKPSEEAGG